LKDTCKKECEADKAGQEAAENDKNIVSSFNITDTGVKHTYINYRSGGGSYKTFHKAHMTLTVYVKAPGVKSGRGIVRATGTVSYNKVNVYKPLMDLHDYASEDDEREVSINDGVGQVELYFYFDIRHKNYQTYKVREYKAFQVSGELINVKEWMK